MRKESAHFFESARSEGSDVTCAYDMSGRFFNTHFYIFSFGKIIFRNNYEMIQILITVKVLYYFIFIFNYLLTEMHHHS